MLTKEMRDSIRHTITEISNNMSILSEILNDVNETGDSRTVYEDIEEAFCKEYPFSKSFEEVDYDVRHWMFSVMDNMKEYTTYTIESRLLSKDDDIIKAFCPFETFSTREEAEATAKKYLEMGYKGCKEHLHDSPYWTSENEIIEAFEENPSAVEMELCIVKQYRNRHDEYLDSEIINYYGIMPRGYIKTEYSVIAIARDEDGDYINADILKVFTNAEEAYEQGCEYSKNTAEEVAIKSLTKDDYKILYYLLSADHNTAFVDISIRIDNYKNDDLIDFEYIDPEELPYLRPIAHPNYR